MYAHLALTHPPVPTVVTFGEMEQSLLACQGSFRVIFKVKLSLKAKLMQRIQLLITQKKCIY